MKGWLADESPATVALVGLSRLPGEVPAPY